MQQHYERWSKAEGKQVRPKTKHYKINSQIKMSFHSFACKRCHSRTWDCHFFGAEHGSYRKSAWFVFNWKNINLYFYQCPINLCAGLPLTYERARSGGIVWQLIGELKPKRTNCLSTIAVGGRYDAMLSDFQWDYIRIFLGIFMIFWKNLIF